MLVDFIKGYAKTNSVLLLETGIYVASDKQDPFYLRWISSEFGFHKVKTLDELLKEEVEHTDLKQGQATQEIYLSREVDAFLLKLMNRKGSSTPDNLLHGEFRKQLKEIFKDTMKIPSVIISPLLYHLSKTSRPNECMVCLGSTYFSLSSNPVNLTDIFNDYKRKLSSTQTSLLRESSSQNKIFAALKTSGRFYDKALKRGIKKHDNKYYLITKIPPHDEQNAEGELFELKGVEVGVRLPILQKRRIDYRSFEPKLFVFSRTYKHPSLDGGYPQRACIGDLSESPPTSHNDIIIKLDNLYTTFCAGHIGSSPFVDLTSENFVRKY